jgi:hypothetical protein
VRAGNGWLKCFTRPSAARWEPLIPWVTTGREVQQERSETPRVGLPNHAPEKKMVSGADSRRHEILLGFLELPNRRIPAGFRHFFGEVGLQRTLSKTRWRGESHSNP